MKCLNRNVLMGLGVLAFAMFFIAPGSRGVLPLLLVAACPLSMILMMFGMSKLRDLRQCFRTTPNQSLVTSPFIGVTSQ